MKTIRFLKPAEHEMLEAMFYYQNKAEGLGRDFISRIDEAVARIGKNPEAYPEIRYAVHRSLVRQFPFALLYKILSDEVLVIAVMHLKRRPSYWLGR